MKVTFCDVYFQPPHTLFYATSSKIIPELHTSPLFFFYGRMLLCPDPIKFNGFLCACKTTARNALQGWPSVKFSYICVALNNVCSLKYS